MQIKTAVRYHLTPVRMTIIKKSVDFPSGPVVKTLCLTEQMMSGYEQVGQCSHCLPCPTHSWNQMLQ